MSSPSGPILFGWPVLASLAAHAVAVATASTVLALVPHAPPPELAPVEVVRADPPPAPPSPPERPRPIVRRDRLVARAPVPRAGQPRATAPALLDDAPRRETAAVDGPAGPAGPGPRFLTGGAGANWAVPDSPGGRGGGGRLLSTKDLALPSGGGGNQTASTGKPEGLTSFARPLGGYQTRPRYPESARRQGIEGETLLRFQVLTDGHVSQVTVARSAGHVDLDRAAMEAVKTWLFDPARRGQEPVVVWVTLPVRFHLQSQSD